MSKALTAETVNMARSKAEELKKLAEQRQQLNVELMNRIAKALEKVKVGTATASAGFAAGAASKQLAAKRSSQPAAAPEAKRPKLDSETDKKMQDIWRMCGSVLEFLWKKKNALIFQRPVDPIRDGVPNYLMVCDGKSLLAGCLPNMPAPKFSHGEVTIQR